jgi:hypothetical protein
MGVRKHIRLVSVLLVGLAGAGLLMVGFGLTPLSSSVFGSMFGLGPKGDYSLSTSSNSVAVPQGSTGIVSITVASLNHFSGDVSLTAAITTSANAPVVTTSQLSIKLTSDATTSVSVTVSTTSSTTLGYYNVTVQGKTDTLSHSIIMLAHVTPPPPPPTPDFYLYANPPSLTTTQGGSVTSTLTISSILSYSGNVALTANIYPSGTNSPNVGLNLTSLRLPAGGTNTTNIFVNTFNSTIGTYTIVVTGISGALAHTTQITLTVNPVTARESLNLEYFNFNSNTSATLNLRNTGTVTTSLVSYFVTDAGGDKYTLANWNGPIISPNGLGIATILIGASCPSCALSGSAFTFSRGNSYTITLVTSYNNRFAYTFTLSAQEALALDSYSFPGTGSSTNVTLYIRNTGAIPVQLASYYVRDSSGNTYALTPWSGPTIAVNSVAAVVVKIGSSCPSCTLTGTPFTFMPGYSYTIIFVTSRNNQFSFTVTR